MCGHLTTNLLGEKGIAALALVHVHELAARVLDSGWGGVDPHKHTDVEVHTQRQHWDNVPFVPICMSLHYTATTCSAMVTLFSSQRLAEQEDASCSEQLTLQAREAIYHFS